MSRLPYLIRKEFLRIRRDPRISRLLIIAPVIQLILFGYAATNDVRDVPLVAYDGDRSPLSRELIQRIARAPYFVLLASADDPRDLERELLEGRAQLAVEIPRDFERGVRRGETPQVGLYVDGTDSNTAGVAAAYLTGYLRRFAGDVAVREARRQGAYGGTVPSLAPEPRVWYNVELKSVNFTVPGVLGLILLVITVNLASLSIVRERETGTFEQLLVTPLTRTELLLGKMIPFVILVMLDAALIFILARAWFHVPFRGSLLLLLVSGLLFLLTTLGTGLVISAASKTQQEAQVLAFLVIMPSVLLSGFMFPIQNMPHAIQLLTYAIPFRYMLQVVRGVFLKGVGLEVLWPQVSMLLLFGIAFFATGVLLFRKRL
jgi:ABC-2 type transport system permease protein